MDRYAWGKCGGGTGVPSSRSIIENTGTFLIAPVFSFKLLTLCQQLEAQAPFLAPVLLRMFSDPAGRLRPPTAVFCKYFKI